MSSVFGKADPTFKEIWNRLDEDFTVGGTTLE